MSLFRSPAKDGAGSRHSTLGEVLVVELRRMARLPRWMRWVRGRLSSSSLIRRGGRHISLNPTIDATPAKDERGSVRALRDKLATFTYRASPSQRLGPLSRKKAPNKRRGQAQDGPAPPDPPAWIRPRAVSPTSQILSPPLHPHLFFHPTTSNMPIAAVMKKGMGSESGSDYGSDEESQKRFPTIPRSAGALASSCTALPPRTPRTSKTPRNPKDVEAGITERVATETKKNGGREGEEGGFAAGTIEEVYEHIERPEA